MRKEHVDVRSLVLKVARFDKSDTTSSLRKSRQMADQTIVTGTSNGVENLTGQEMTRVLR